MAIRYAVAAGNWSDAATWDGGASIPASGDYVYANGYGVMLDVDVNIGAGTLSTEVCPTTGIGGGSFDFSVNRTIISNVFGGTSHCIVGSAYGCSLNIIGNVEGTSATACGISHRITTTNTSPLNITGNVNKYAIFIYRGSNGVIHNVQITGNCDTTGGYCMLGRAVNISLGASFVTIDGIITGNAYEFADPASISAGGFGQTGLYVINGGVVAQTALRVVCCATAIVTGYIENFGGKLAVDASTTFQFTPTYYKIQDADGNDVILYPSTTLENPPAE